MTEGIEKLVLQYAELSRQLIKEINLLLIDNQQKEAIILTQAKTIKELTNDIHE